MARQAAPIVAQMAEQATINDYLVMLVNGFSFGFTLIFLVGFGFFHNGDVPMLAYPMVGTMFWLAIWLPVFVYAKLNTTNEKSVFYCEIE